MSINSPRNINPWSIKTFKGIKIKSIKTAVLTGSTSKIATELALLALKDGYQLVNPIKFKVMSGAYAQSKAAVKVLMHSLQQQESNVSYCVVDLPPTKTSMAKSAAMPLFLKWFSFIFSEPKQSAKKLYEAARSSTVIKLDKSQQLVLKDLVALADSLT